MAETYNLIFVPELRENADPEIVKQKLSKTLNIGLEKVEAWYESDEPTTLLTEVSDDIADRYMKAILKCGAVCNVESNSVNENGLSLIPKQFTTTDTFICPSCHHEEQINIGEKLPKCPQCGLVIAKYEEKMKAEKEKAEIRLRLMRDQRVKTDRDDDHVRKRDELNRIRALEREIMEELGIKPPGRLWLFYDQHTVVLSFAIFVMIVSMTAMTLRFVDNFLGAAEQAELAETQPSEEIQQMAPVLSAAVQLQQAGTVEMVEQLAKVSGLMQGRLPQTNQQITEAAKMMLKGAGPEAFVKLASAAGAISANDPADIINLPGVEQFNLSQIKTIAPTTLPHGPEHLIQVLSEKKTVLDASNPDNPPKTIYTVERLDGSTVINLVKQMNQHQEWDLYLLALQEEFVEKGDIDKASEIANRIKNPQIKVQALGNIIIRRLLDGDTSDTRILAARVQTEILRIESPDLKARTILTYGQAVSDAGIDTEPRASMHKVNEMMEVEDDLYTKSIFAGRLAVAHYRQGTRDVSTHYLESAINSAGAIQSKPKRLSAFIRLAQRYYDVRNTLMAQQILSNALTQSADLPAETRSVLYAEIALGQGYMGDFPGAMLSISNTGQVGAQQQVLSKLAELLIDNDRLYQAISIMNMVSDETLYGQLQFRLVSSMINKGDEQSAARHLDDARLRSINITDVGSKALLTSQYAHLYFRLGQTDRANILFDTAISLSESLDGRKSDLTRGFTAMEQARSFMIHKSFQTLASIQNSMIRGALESEVLVLERIEKIFFNHDEGPR